MITNQNIIFKLILDDYTASITNSPKAKNDILIPCSVIYFQLIQNYKELERIHSNVLISRQFLFQKV